MFYLIEKATDLAIWCGNVAPILDDVSASCGDEMFMCFNKDTAQVIEHPSVDLFEQFKYVLDNGSLIIYSGWVPAPTPTPVDLLQITKSELFSKVDDQIELRYNKYTRFTVEYNKREAMAREFRSSGYVGEPHVLISTFAAEVGLSNQAAADLTISQADSIGAALDSMGSVRMRKYRILRASTVAECREIYNSILVEADNILSRIV